MRERRPVLLPIFAAVFLTISSSPAAWQGSVHTGPWERLVTIVLSDVEQLAQAPEGAIAASRFGPLPMDKESVVRPWEVQEAVAEGRPIVRLVNATLVATLWDDASKRWIAAGYEEVPVPEGMLTRVPYLQVVEAEHQGMPLACTFSFGQPGDGKGLVLHEVVALDPQRVYLVAERNGEPTYLSARYAFRKAWAS